MEVRPQSDPRHAFGAMDALRTLAAAIVAISHVRDLMMVEYDSGGGAGMRAFYFLTGFGHAGVIVFFVLSGFWITKSVVQRSSVPGPFWSKYLIDRVSRLWVVLVPVLVLGGALDWYGAHVLRSAIYAGTSGAWSVTRPIRLDMPVFLANVTFLQTIVTPVFGSNGPLWSLAYEFWYYIWFPALWLAIRGRPSWMLLGLLVVLLDWMVLFGFLSWVCGALLYLLVERGKRTPPSRLAARVILVTGLVATAAMLTVLRLLHGWWMDPLLALAFATLLFGLCLLDPRMPGIRPLAAYGARSSFSLYAIHFPVAALAAALMLPNGRMQATWGAVLLVLAVIAVIGLLGYLFSLVTEANTAKIRRLLTHKLVGTDVGRGVDPAFSQKDVNDRVEEAG